MHISLPTFGVAKPPVTEDQPLPPEQMTSTEFVLWLNGALDVLSAQIPTQEQWDRVRDRVQQQVGQIVAQRIRAASEKDYYEAKGAASQGISSTAIYGTATYGMAKPNFAQGLASYQAKVDEYKRQAEAYEKLAQASMSAVNLSKKSTG